MEEKLRNVKSTAHEFMEFLLDRVSLYGVKEWANLKLFLISLGILIGCSCSKFFSRVKFIVKIAALVSGIYLFIKTFYPLFAKLEKR